MGRHRRPKARFLPPTAYFDDGQRLIDLVLVYHEADDTEIAVAPGLRQEFESLMTVDGIDIEHLRIYQLVFVKLHTTFAALCKAAEAMKYELPIAYSDLPPPPNDYISRICHRLHWPNPFALQDKFKFDHDQLYLLEQQVYDHVYPLHDDDHDLVSQRHSNTPVKLWPLRRYLYACWASPRQFYKCQPLNQIRDYFGEKVGLYFAWLGLYTQSLILPSIFGLFLVLFNALVRPIWIGVDDPVDEQHEFFCKNNSRSPTVFCRDCTTTSCPFERPIDLCRQSTISAVFDNHSTVIYSLFMAIWSVVLMQRWTRRESELACYWSVAEQRHHIQQVRADYKIKVKTTQFDYVSREHEPRLPVHLTITRVIGSLCTVLFFLLVVLALLAGVKVYRVVGQQLWDPILMYKEAVTEYHLYYFDPNMVVSITASLANGVCIMIMDQIYSRIVLALTKFEYCRTDHRFETSYTYKMIVFKFVNFYGALLYLVFFRPVFTGTPFTADMGNRCPATGCLLDVSVQLFIIMSGKQLLNNIAELGMPLLRNWFRRRSREIEAGMPRCVQDELLDPVEQIPLFSDYQEMLIQYGFVTMFAAALPLAPIFALANNIIEIRLDAYKHLTQTKRCIAERTSHNRPWTNLLYLFTHIGVVVNACVIAFSSSFVDHLVYTAMKTDGHHHDEYKSFIDFTTVHVNTTNFCEPSELDEWTRRIGNDTWMADTLDTAYFFGREYEFRHCAVPRPYKADFYDDEEDLDLDCHNQFSDNDLRYFQSVLALRETNLTVEEYAREMFDDDTVTNEFWVKTISNYLLYQPPESCNGGIRLMPTDQPQWKLLINKCLIRDYRMDEHGKFARSSEWYHVWVGRLAFVLTFVLLVQGMQKLIKLLVPSRPRHVKQHERRQELLRNQLMHMEMDEEDTTVIVSNGGDKVARESGNPPTEVIMENVKEHPDDAVSREEDRMLRET